MAISTPNKAQRATAKRLLVAEGAFGGAPDACAAAAEGVYDKLNAQLSPLVGGAGFLALFARSAKLSQGELTCLGEAAVVESSTKLRACLSALGPVAAAETAETLFGNFLALITIFIGERLTTQALRRAWPTLQEWASTEIEK